MSGYFFILIFLAILWLFLIRPRQRRMRAQQQQVASLDVGDEILTAGGVYGIVRAIEGDELHVEIASQVVVRVARRAVAAVLTEKSERQLEVAEPPEDPDATLPDR